MSQLLHDLLRLAAYAGLGVTDAFGRRRLRIAVSPAEWAVLREEMFAGQHVFYARILDIPLVVELEPLNPELKMETK